MARIRFVTAACVAAAVLASAAPVRADCLDFDDAAVRVVRGVIRGVAGAGDVAYRVAHGEGGFGHVQGAVEVQWTQAGEALRQTIFHAMHDGPPAAVARTARGLQVRVRYCMTGTDVCRARTAAYVYDPAQRRFRGANAAARTFVATTCQ